MRPTTSRLASRRQRQYQTNVHFAAPASFPAALALSRNLFLPTCGIMAGHAGLAFRAGMSLDRLQILVVMAIAAELQNVLRQQIGSAD